MEDKEEKITIHKKIWYYMKDRGHKYKFPRKNVIENKWIGISYIIWTLIFWIGVIVWVFHNNNHVDKNNNFESTLRLKLHGSIFTNYKKEDFNENYVKEEEFSNYNRPWSSIDYMSTFANEKLVMTNMAITSNQTISNCAQSPLLHNVHCDPMNNLCKRGKKTTNGVQTGKCVKADFPYLDEDNNWISNISTCEIKGKFEFLIKIFKLNFYLLIRWNLEIILKFMKKISFLVPNKNNE
jgi:hypothetical protein